jgi:hypothetical protein
MTLHQLILRQRGRCAARRREPPPCAVWPGARCAGFAGEKTLGLLEAHPRSHDSDSGDRSRQPGATVQIVSDAVTGNRASGLGFLVLHRDVRRRSVVIVKHTPMRKE